jgi:type I restriction enzyme R subunit
VSLTPSPNFQFLSHHDAHLVLLGTQAERLFADDPSACLAKLRMFGEVLAQRAAARLGLYGGPSDTQASLLGRLAQRGAAPDLVVNLFHGLRVAGNAAVHEGKGDHGQALHQLKMAFELAIWFQRAFGNNKKFDPGPFVPPLPPRDSASATALTDELAALRAAVAAGKAERDAARAAFLDEERRRLGAERLAAHLEEEAATFARLALESEADRSRDREAFEARLAEELAALSKAALTAAPATIQATVDRASAAGAAIQLSEADTRRLIDQQLRDAGWEADSPTLTHAGGARAQKGKNLAIAEWPTSTGPADYVLFAGLEALGVVEAKKLSVDVPEVLKQAQRYAKNLVLDSASRPLGGPWEAGILLPFLFATNGRPYLEQLKTKSGIWFRDARRAKNLPRALRGWYTPEGLRDLLKQDALTAHAKLEAESVGYLDLRDYQIRAIHAVEHAIAAGQRSCILAMATGTGKTRTAIGLVYRLLKSQRFKRILFLVDRSALGEQTENAFKDVRLENLQTFAQIYNVKGLGEGSPDSDTKLQIATIQSMVSRIVGADDGDKPAVDAYDCVIIDECHRGYTLDQEMSEAELRFRSQADYMSSYRRALDHFDAVKIGLTATPAQHTKEIFGAPVFLYSYREAVIDGCLVDHEPPFSIATELSEEGMVWKKGDKMRRFDPRKQAADLVDVPDEVKLDIDAFNSRVITESWNRVVCEELAKLIDPTSPTKTLVFCATDAHADIVVQQLKLAFTTVYGEVEDDAVIKITGSPTVDKPLQKIRQLKNERLPNVVVTVDLLTTGIDVPKIGNIVFLRRVKSRILYEQMLGRATRLCPEIDKTSFRIFDAVRLYEALEPFTSMTPVVQDVSVPFSQLVRELTTAPDQEARELVLEQLVAKLQRKRQALKDDAASRFESLAEMPAADLARLLKEKTPEAAAAWFGEHTYLIPFLDTPWGDGKMMIVSDHVDAIRSVTRGYGKGEKPQDYLDGFAEYLRSNLNQIPALIVVTQRPRDLTRAALKELKIALDAKGYSEVALRTAWQSQTNADIAASIIGFIRKAALGDALVPYAERVDKALVKIGARQAWTPVQKRWLARIGKQLKVEEVVDQEAFERGQFKDDGGFVRIDKDFEGRLGEVLGDLREAIWEQAG